MTGNACDIEGRTGTTPTYAIRHALEVLGDQGYDEEIRGAALAELDDLGAERDQARAALSEWRHGSDWMGEGSGPMPDRVLILRLEKLLGTRAA